KPARQFRLGVFAARPEPAGDDACRHGAGLAYLHAGRPPLLRLQRRIGFGVRDRGGKPQGTHTNSCGESSQADYRRELTFESETVTPVAPEPELSTSHSRITGSLW